MNKLRKDAAGRFYTLATELGAELARLTEDGEKRLYINHLGNLIATPDVDDAPTIGYVDVHEAQFHRWDE
jgi:hypothetical protein